MPKRITIIPEFTDEECCIILSTAPTATHFYTDPTHQIRYAETSVETFISAARWKLEPDALALLIASEGADLRYTSPAAFAYSLWLRDYAPPGYILPNDGYRSDLCRASLYGGRCEVYRYVDDEPAHQYDLTAAYPYASTQLTYPDPRTLHYAKPPTLDNIHRYEGVSNVTFSQDGNHPVLPIRRGGRTIYPHCDHAAGTFTHAELRYALCHVPNVTIHSVSKQYIANSTLTANPFTRFVEYCYERRVRTGLKIWKIIANSLFGRLAVGGQGLWRWTPTADLSGFRTLPTDRRGFFGVPCEGKQTTAPTRGNVLWAAMVLAQARTALHSYLTPDTVYIDTDCLFCATPQPLPLSDNLGGWKYKFGHYRIRGTQAYQRVDPDTGEIYETKLRGNALATRKPTDFYRAQTTQERTRLADGRTVPLILTHGGYTSSTATNILTC